MKNLQEFPRIPLAVLPTPDLLEGVRLIYQQTPRWALMKSAVMH